MTALKSTLGALLGGPPPQRSARRVWVEAALWGVLAGLVCYAFNRIQHASDARDFQATLYISQAILEGRYPFGLEYSALAVPYPLTAGVLAVPLAWMPSVIAGCVFIGLTVSLMAAAFLRAGEDWRLLALLSWSSVYTIWWNQWAFAMTALWYLPALSVLAVVKPQMAAPVMLTGACGRHLLQRRWAFVIWPVLVLLISLAIYPGWIPDWLSKVGHYQGKTPPLFSLPFGPLILIALFAWRDRRCWLVLALAAFPQRMAYDQLPLALAAANPLQMAIFVAFSWIDFVFYRFVFGGWDKIPGGWQNLIVLTFYVPMALVVAWPPLRTFIARRARPN